MSDPLPPPSGGAPPPPPSDPGATQPMVYPPGYPQPGNLGYPVQGDNLGYPVQPNLGYPVQPGMMPPPTGFPPPSTESGPVQVAAIAEDEEAVAVEAAPGEVFHPPALNHFEPTVSQNPIIKFWRNACIRCFEQRL